MTKLILGEQLQVAGWALKGFLPPEELAEVLKGAVLRMGMTTAGMDPVIRQYPLPTGKGGVGHTIFLPLGDPDDKHIGILQKILLALVKLILGRQRFASMIFQPLVESFIVADTYPEQNKIYVLAASCKTFRPQTITRYLSRKVGPVTNLTFFEL